MEYNLEAIVKVSIYTTVEAETLEEAIQIAHNKEMMSVASNNGDTSDYCWMLDEIDGQPQSIHES